MGIVVLVSWFFVAACDAGTVPSDNCPSLFTSDHSRTRSRCEICVCSINNKLYSLFSRNAEFLYQVVILKIDISCLSNYYKFDVSNLMLCDQTPAFFF